MAPFHGVPADAEAAVDRAADGVRRDGRRGLHERLRSPTRVEHVALGGRARAHRRGELVVTADGRTAPRTASSADPARPIGVPATTASSIRPAGASAQASASGQAVPVPRS